MRLILNGRLKPAGCYCTDVKANPENPDHRTGISVARSCPVHGHMLDGYMWHPALGCDCIITKFQNGGGETNVSKCKRHKIPQRPRVRLPIEPTVMK